MKDEKKIEVLSLLDFERLNVLSGVTRSSEIGIIKDDSWSDGKCCEVVYSSCSESEVDHLIKSEIDLARSAQYELEWKVYGHDEPHCLGERLAAAGFEAGDREAFLVFAADEQALERFGIIQHDIKKITCMEGLRDYQLIQEEVSGRSAVRQIDEFRDMLENHPSEMSVYVAYVDGEPAACGRTYYLNGSRIAGLYGGQTRERFRKQGLFTQLVATRIREALERGIFMISVDALPTSEPIFKKYGFEFVTFTQPYYYTFS